MGDDTTETAPVVDKNPEEKAQEGGDTAKKGRADAAPAATDDPLEKCPEPPTDPKDDDPAVGDALRTLQVEAATGDALKPVIAEKLAYAQGANTVNIKDAYTKAYKNSLRSDYDDADGRFKATAAELNRSVDGQPSPLEAWIGQWLGEKGKISAVFNNQRQKALRLRARTGPRECELAKAQQEAKRRKQAYEDWKSPDQKIKQIIASYKDRLPKLSCDAHGGDAYAIYQFWFEVAPLHLRLRPDTVDDANAPGVDRLRAALGNHPARCRALTSARDRKDGNLYLIDPEKLDEHRKQVLEDWKTAVVTQVEKQVDYTLRPDDAASLTKDLAKLITDEPTDIKNKLQPKS